MRKPLTKLPLPSGVQVPLAQAKWIRPRLAATLAYRSRKSRRRASGKSDRPERLRTLTKRQPLPAGDPAVQPVRFAHSSSVYLGLSQSHPARDPAGECCVCSRIPRSANSMNDDTPPTLKQTNSPTNDLPAPNTHPLPNNTERPRVQRYFGADVHLSRTIAGDGDGFGSNHQVRDRHTWIPEITNYPEERTSDRSLIRSA